MNIQLKTPVEMTDKANKINHNLHKEESQKATWLYLISERFKAFFLQIKL